MDHHVAHEFILARLEEEFDPRLTYHCLEHTLDVFARVIDISSEEKLEGPELIVLKTAALFHDSGFLLGYEDHEELGCVLLAEVLPEFGYDMEAIITIQTMIMATKIRALSSDRSSRILCDADLDYLGRSDFKMIGDRLFKELVAYGKLETELEWNIRQVKFLRHHKYHTEINKTTRTPQLLEHLRQLEQWLQENDR